MNNRKLRFVKCPRCLTVLPELLDTPVYRCGNCSTRLRATPKDKSVSTHGSEDPLPEENSASSVPPASPIEPDVPALPSPDVSRSEALNRDSESSHVSLNTKSPDARSPPIPNPRESPSEAVDPYFDHSDIKTPTTITSVGYYDDGNSSNDEARRALRFPRRCHDPHQMRNYNDRRSRRENWQRSNEKDAIGMLNEMKRLNLIRERKPKRNDCTSVIMTVGGAAPFVACYFCFDLLILPSDFLLFGKRRRRLKCAACGQICCFSLVNGSLIATPSKEIIPLHRLMGYPSVSQVIGRKGASTSRVSQIIPKKN